MNNDVAALAEALVDVVRGAARLQARQEMLECIALAWFTTAGQTTPDARAAVLRTARADFLDRCLTTREKTAPESVRDAMALHAVFARACGLPADDGKLN